MIVADTCLIFHLFNETSLTEIAQRILDKDGHWVMPVLWRAEYANVLAKLARKESRGTSIILTHFANTVDELKDFEVEIDTKKALATALTYKISVYDAHFISLAIDSHSIVVTEDQEILKKCPKLSCSMHNFLIPPQ